ncbi:MAG: hypothetical protein SRB1_01851 [Desulfobacteraceae bacterium Eth-SRB1]|nr:MAG: hypothetical protein SRB1_01851 [Desulfobacteraceae bacterium Eth-SRB1]
MQGRYRNMYYATGLPGWMRFGYSPGWVGRTPGGFPPSVQYMRAGTWQTPQPQAMASEIPVGMPATPGHQEISILESQAAMLEQQLEQIKKRIEELKK